MLLRCKRKYGDSPEMLLHSVVHHGGQGMRAIVLMPTAVLGEYTLEEEVLDYLIVLRSLATEPENVK